VLLRNKKNAGWAIMVTAEQMHDLLPATDAKASQSTRQDLAVGTPRSATAGAITRAGFLDLIDRCVRHFAALLGGAPTANDDPLSAAAPVEGARVQLWRWLHGSNAVLEDGTPIDFNLFDAAIQRVGERLPRRGLRGQEYVLQAAWLLAELTHARTLPPQAALVPPLARTL
jgi:malate synthase